MSTVREILAAAQEAGFSSKRHDVWIALVVLTEEKSGGDAGKVAEHFDMAKDYPLWSPADLARYGPRIALRGPAVIAEMGRAGIEGLTGAAGDAIEEAIEPIVEIARLPVRVLQWLTDPGTMVRVAKVLGGGALIIGGLLVLARGQVTRNLDKIVAVAGATPQGRGAKAAAGAAAAKGATS